MLDNTVAKAQQSTMSNEGALATLNDESALAELASGVLSKHIAARFGVSSYAVRKRLAKHPEYPQAICDQAEAIVEQALDYTLTCDADTVAIARARYEVAFKYAACRDPSRWGNRTQISGADGNALTINNIAITFVKPEPDRSATIEHDPASVVDTNLD